MAAYFSRIAFALFAAAAGAQAAPTAAPSNPRAAAVFAGGCFWCTESDFDKVPGVVSTTSGFTGGTLVNPTYEQVSAGGTGHIESVRVVYDPRRVSYAALAAHFIKTIDPLDAGGSFCDRGPTYRSAFFVENDAQRRIALATNKRAEAVLKKRVATLILRATTFYPAEGYHQDYYKKNPLRYRFYRFNCGRDARLKALWGGKSAG